LQEVSPDSVFSWADRTKIKQKDRPAPVNKVKMYSSDNNLVTNRFISAFVSTAFVFITAGMIFAAPPLKSPDRLEVFRQSNGTFYTAAADNSGSFRAMRWGSDTDVLVPGDYDGDGATDAAVWRPESGVWYVLQSHDASAMFIKWGASSDHRTAGVPDVPVPADYDGDGKTDIAVWRAETGEWLVLFSSFKFDQRKAGTFRWGANGDVPVQADYDGDGRADYAIFRPLGNQWMVLESSTGSWKIRSLGSVGDQLVPADYTGDGKADIAVYRSGVWQVLNSETQEMEPFKFGFKDDLAAPGDYDGDGQTDFAVFRKGTWYIYDSATPRFRSVNFGDESDIPLSSLRAK
jgi:hypothetical protein